MENIYNKDLGYALIVFLTIPGHIQECKGSILYHCKRVHLELYLKKKKHQKLDFRLKRAHFPLILWEVSNNWVLIGTESYD